MSRKLISLTVSSCFLLLCLGTIDALPRDQYHCPEPYTADRYPNQIIVNNRCSYPVWLGIQGNAPGANNNPPRKCSPFGGGVALPARRSQTITFPVSWAGRLWGRNKCDNNGKNCLSGDCFDLGTQCQGEGPTNSVPVTLAEVAFDAFNSMTFYDVSVVDAYNLPMTIEPAKGVFRQESSCATTFCTDNNVLSQCPGDLQVKNKGVTASCKTDCFKARTTPGTSQAVRDEFCCEGEWDRNRCADVECKRCKVQPCRLCTGGKRTKDHFKSKCPNVYTFPNDDIGKRGQNGQLSCQPLNKGKSTLNLYFC